MNAQCDAITNFHKAISECRPSAVRLCWVVDGSIPEEEVKAKRRVEGEKECESEDEERAGHSTDVAIAGSPTKARVSMGDN
jgi:hypothetical protein